MNNGVIFCHPANRKHLNQFIPSIIIINHVWKGAAPSLIKRGIIKSKFCKNKKLKLEKRIYVNLFSRQNMMNIAEADACTKKYFKADSLERMFFCSTMKGIKESIFNSRPIQAPNQLDEEIDKIDLVIIITKNKMFKLFKINKENFIYYIMVYRHERF